ncbi:MAG: ABC transporter permease [Bacteroidetes bacterium]|nr:ABC transporter permease [Bacteroidota bacterium]
MRTILFLIQKEFLQIFRNKGMIPIIFAVPIVQLVIIVHAATFELKNVNLYVVDNDRTTTSRSIIHQFEGSHFFSLSGFSFNYSDGEESLRRNSSDAVLCIPRGFEKKLVEGQSTGFQMVVNAINGSAGGLINGYTVSMVNEFNRGLSSGRANFTLTKPKFIDLTYSFWYNPELNYTTFMVPGILVILVTVISLLLSGMNIVKEKEIGTIEQINVSPIRKYQFITGKLVPTLIIALFELSFGLVIGKIFFNIPLEGNLLLLFLSAFIYILVILGMGLMVSTFANTQQQAMFVSFFFMIVFLLMSGLFTSVENMPQWAQTLNQINPVAHFIRIIRMILLKGSGFQDIQNNLAYLLGLAFLSLSLAIRRYRKTV